MRYARVSLQPCITETRLRAMRSSRDYRLSGFRVAILTMNNQLTVQGKPIAITAVPDIRVYIAEKAGITLPARVKGTPWVSTKDVVALAEAAGASRDSIKLWRKELDAARKEHYVHSGMVVGMLAADPTVRKNVRLAINAKGEVIGANATFRRERSRPLALAAENAQLRAQVAKLMALVQPAS